MLCHFQTHIDAQTVLCMDEELNSILFHEFWQDVCEQATQIQTLKAQTWALWETESYHFLVLLFAALVAHKDVIIAPHRVKDLELEFAQQGIYFLARQNQLFENRSQCAVAKPIQTSDLNLDDHFLNQAHVYFYTSGSTGQAKKIPRTLRQLLNEIQGLNQSFALPDASIAIATVSHQHIYGLLFKLLLPLASGRCFYQSQLAFPEDVVNAQKKLARLERQNYVISSPALLKRWTKDVQLENSCMVYSSGGKLDSGVRSFLNASIVEILGSSETGGIGYRQQDNALWTPFANVEIQITEQEELAVRTNHAFHEDWILTGDRAQAVQQNNLKTQFELLGRLDRIVKLEEKRLSLDAIEQKILSLEGVEQCHVLLLEHEHRQILACVTVLSDHARDRLIHSNKVSFIRQIKALLKDKLETIAIPRQWRFLTQLPQNAQSKLNKNAMRSLFDNLLYPIVLGQKNDFDQALIQLEFPPELACFKGHFPNYAIYPGVGQIGFVQYFAKQIWADLAWCCGYEQLKFQDLIHPYALLELKLIRKQHKVFFEIFNAEKTLASGRLLFELDAEFVDNNKNDQVESV